MKTFILAFGLSMLAFSNYSCAQQESKQQTRQQPTTEHTEAAPTTTPAQVVDIDVDQFKGMMGQADVVILDVRTPEEVAQGKISENALNIDVTNKPLFEQEIEKLDKDKTYLVYCRSGRRSRIAAEEMVQRGFRKVYNLKGGILAWQQANQ